MISWFIFSTVAARLFAEKSTVKATRQKALDAEQEVQHAAFRQSGVTIEPQGTVFERLLSI